jgi:hypothetical protein
MAFVAWVPPLQPCTPVGSWPPELHEGRGVREHGRMEHRPQELGAVTMAAGVRRAPCGAGATNQEASSYAMCVYACEPSGVRVAAHVRGSGPIGFVGAVYQLDRIVGWLKFVDVGLPMVYSIISVNRAREPN